MGKRAASGWLGGHYHSGECTYILLGLIKMLSDKNFNRTKVAIGLDYCIDSGVGRWMR